MNDLEGADELNRKLKALRDGTASRALLLELGNEVVRNATVNLQPHDKTGNLSRSIRVAEVDENAQTIQVRAGGTQGVNYAAYLEFGTGIYGPNRRPIVPVRAKALRFPASGAATRLSGNLTSAQQRAGGGWQFRKSVRGVKPVKYMENAINDTARGINLAPTFTAVWNKA